MLRSQETAPIPFRQLILGSIQTDLRHKGLEGTNLLTPDRSSNSIFNQYSHDYVQLCNRFHCHKTVLKSATIQYLYLFPIFHLYFIDIFRWWPVLEDQLEQTTIADCSIIWLILPCCSSDKPCYIWSCYSVRENWNRSAFSSSAYGNIGQASLFVARAEMNSKNFVVWCELCLEKRSNFTPLGDGQIKPIIDNKNIGC